MVNLKSDSVTVVVDSVGDNNTTWTVLLTSTAGWQSITGRAGLGTGHGQRQAELLLLELCALKIGCQCSNEKMKMKKKKKKKREQKLAWVKSGFVKSAKTRHGRNAKLLR
ncbi:NUT family member [Trichinella pseudospiralis]